MTREQCRQRRRCSLVWAWLAVPSVVSLSSGGSAELDDEASSRSRTGKNIPLACAALGLTLVSHGGGGICWDL